MYNIVVERECGCFKRSDLENNVSVSSKDEALEKSLAIVDTMNKKFCKKHTFSLVEQENNFLIVMN